MAKSGLWSGRDRLGFRVAQPLRIISGGFATMLPTAFDYSTMTATTSLERFSLSPRGHDLDAEMSYGRPVTASGWLGGNLFMRHQPGHIASAPDDLGGAIRFSLGF